MTRAKLPRLAAALLSLASCGDARVLDLQADCGAVPDDASSATTWKNGGIFNATLPKLQPGDTLRIPNQTFHVMGGIVARDLVNVTLQLDGTLVLSDDVKAWPRDAGGHILEFLHLSNVTSFTFTSGNRAQYTGGGTLEGKGSSWWGIPGVGYLERGENRPRMLKVTSARGVLLEHILFKDPPYWTTMVEKVDGYEVRRCEIDAWRVSRDRHTAIDLTAFNTDGFDFTGRNIHIHDCKVWNQDDSFCVKDGTSNVLVENVQSSGLGITVGSINSDVRNVTFRNVYMYHTYKGIYMKFRGSGSISDVTYENIWMEKPEQWPIWIGPAQQSDSDELCAAHPCSLCWPHDPWAKCSAPAHAYYRNILLRNVTVNTPVGGYDGLLLADAQSSPMVNVTFDDVVILNPSTKKHRWGRGYFCEGVQSGVATGRTNPVPSCFKDQTDGHRVPERDVFV